MLINKSRVSEGDIIALKLVNGDEIVAKLVKDNGDSWELDRPCTVMPSAQGIGLIQSLFTADPKITSTTRQRAGAGEITKCRRNCRVSEYRKQCRRERQTKYRSEEHTSELQSH